MGPTIENDDLHRANPGDSFGHDLVERRIAAIEKLLPGYLESSHPSISLEGVVTTTGIGSSRAHAQYFASLLNAIPGISAQYRDVSLLPNGERFPGKVALFSQGLSANSNGVLEQQIADRAGVLFTAATIPGAEAAGKERVAENLRRAGSCGIGVVQMPLENEYQILVRTIGPWFGYLAAYRAAASLPDSPFAPVTQDTLADTFDTAREQSVAILSQTSRDELRRLGAYFVGHSPENGYMGNLAIKLLEGAFLAEPPIKAAIEFDHGAFQVVARNGGRVFLFSGGTESEEHYASALDRALLSESDGQPLLKVTSNLPPPLRILHYEMVMNHVMLALMRQGGSACDQINFPDGASYHRVT